MFFEALIRLSWDWSSSSNNFPVIGKWVEHKAQAIMTMLGQTLIAVTQQCNSICTEGQEFRQNQGDIGVFRVSKCSHNFAG